MNNQNRRAIVLLICKILGLIIGYAISWGITIGIIKLVTMCFSLNFSIPIATGIWIILCVIKLMFPSKKE